MEKPKLKLVFPRAEDYKKRPSTQGGRALKDLSGKVIAFLDDGRPNANVALASIREELVSEFKIRPVIVEHKVLGLRSGDSLPKDVFERLVNEVDAVVVGIAS